MLNYSFKAYVIVYEVPTTLFREKDIPTFPSKIV